MKQHKHDPPMHNVTQKPNPARPSAPALNAKAQKVVSVKAKGKGGPLNEKASGKTVPPSTIGKGKASPKVMRMPL